MPKERQSHQRQLVDGSSPFYKQLARQQPQSHQRQLVDGSSPLYLFPTKANIVLQATQCGSERTTNCRWWDLKVLNKLTLCRKDLNEPHTPV